MSGWEPPRPTDPDDWFGESLATAGRREADDWLDDQPPSRRRPGDIYGVDLRLWLAGAAVLVVLVVAGLAVAGVFSGGGNEQATSTPSVQTPTTTPTQTATKPAAKPPAVPATTLKPGDTGIEVKRLQRALAFLGYSVGKVDGDYGSATQAALKKFQQAKKLDADGVLGPKTLAALKLALQSA